MAGAGLKTGFADALDAAVEEALRSTTLRIPGAAVLARRGPDTYCKAFGYADSDTKAPMTKDAMLRFYSMTKVQTSCVAMMLAEKGWLSFDDPVSKYVASFDREWQVVGVDGADDDQELEHYDAMTGQTRSVRYRLTPAKEAMLVKHLASEHSGLAYEFWSDVGFSQEYAVAWELRRRVAPGYYSSLDIVGSDLPLPEWCDAVAEAGVLVCEPGTFSYGLGATVLGRVIEVAFKRGSGEDKRFDQILTEMLWKPLGMDEAAFFLSDGDPRVGRVPVLYGAELSADGLSATVKRIEQCYTGPCGNQCNHVSGPRRHYSGDTGSLMPIEDYAKFYDFLLRRGLTSGGERLLSETGVETLCKHAHPNLNDCVPMTAIMQGGGLKRKQHFSFGWVTTYTQEGQEEIQGELAIDHPRRNYWNGYSGVHGSLFLDDDAYILVCPQLMGNTSGAKFLGEVFKNPILTAFLGTWGDTGKISS